MKSKTTKKLLDQAWLWVKKNSLSWEFIATSQYLIVVRSKLIIQKFNLKFGGWIKQKVKHNYKEMNNLEDASAEISQKPA